MKGKQRRTGSLIRPYFLGSGIGGWFLMIMKLMVNWSSQSQSAYGRNPFQTLTTNQNPVHTYLHPWFVPWTEFHLQNLTSADKWRWQVLYNEASTIVGFIHPKNGAGAILHQHDRMPLKYNNSWTSKRDTLQGTNISHSKDTIESMIFLSPRWGDMLIPWRVSQTL